MSDDQFIQLQSQITGLDNKFSNQMLNMQTQVQNLDKSLLKMFKYMSKRFDGIDKKLDEKADKSTVNLMYNQLDGFLKRIDTDETERAALTAQANRHQTWIHQIAEKTDIKLSY